MNVGATAAERRCRGGTFSCPVIFLTNSGSCFWCHALLQVNVALDVNGCTACLRHCMRNQTLEGSLQTSIASRWSGSIYAALPLVLFRGCHCWFVPW